MVTQILRIWWLGFRASGEPSVGQEAGLYGMAFSPSTSPHTKYTKYWMSITTRIVLIWRFTFWYLVTRVLLIWWPECWPRGWTVWHGRHPLHHSPHTKIPKLAFWLSGDPGSGHLVTRVLAGRLDCVARHPLIIQAKCVHCHFSYCTVQRHE